MNYESPRTSEILFDLRVEKVKEREKQITFWEEAITRNQWELEDFVSMIARVAKEDPNDQERIDRILEAIHRNKTSIKAIKSLINRLRKEMEEASEGISRYIDWIHNKPRKTKATPSPPHHNHFL